MKKRVFIWAPIVMATGVLVSGGCDLSPTELEPLDGGLRFSISEVHRGVTPSAPVIQLDITTDRHYPAVGQIRGDIEVVSGIIYVPISGISACTGPNCVHWSGPAFRREVIALAEGEYPLVITYRGSTDLYTVSLTPEAIEVSPVSASFTTPRFQRFWRFPRNSFAYHCDAENHAAACDAFREILIGEIALIPLSFADGGIVPYPRPLPDWSAEYFRYQSAYDFQNAGRLLEEFGLEHPGVSMRLMNWRSQHHILWPAVP